MLAFGQEKRRQVGESIAYFIDYAIGDMFAMRQVDRLKGWHFFNEVLNSLIRDPKTLGEANIF